MKPRLSQGPGYFKPLDRYSYSHRPVRPRILFFPLFWYVCKSFILHESWQCLRGLAVRSYFRFPACLGGFSRRYSPDLAFMLFPLLLDADLFIQSRPHRGRYPRDWHETPCTVNIARLQGLQRRSSVTFAWKADLTNEFILPALQSSSSSCMMWSSVFESPQQIPFAASYTISQSSSVKLPSLSATSKSP